MKMDPYKDFHIFAVIKTCVTGLKDKDTQH